MARTILKSNQHVYILALVSIITSIYLSSCKPTFNLITFSSDGSELAIAQPHGRVEVYKIGPYEDNELVINSKIGLPMCIGFSPDGSVIAVGGQNILDEDEIRGEVALFNSQTGEETRRFYFGSKFATAIAMSSHVNVMAIGGVNEILIMDPISESKVTTFSTTKAGAFGLRFSPNGGLLASALTPIEGIFSVIVWDMETFSTLFTINEGSLPFAFSPDGQFIAVTDSIHGEVAIYETSGGTKVKEFIMPSDSHPIAVVFDPFGGQIAAADMEDKVIVWDFFDKEVTHKFDFPTLALSFTSNGRYLLLTDGEDFKAIDLWEE